MMKNEIRFLQILAAHRIGELVPAIPKEKTGRGKKTPRDSGTFPESQRLSEFRLLAGAMIAPISGDYKTVKMVKDAAPGLFMGDLKRVWDKLKIGSPLRESRLKSGGLRKAKIWLEKAEGRELENRPSGGKVTNPDSLAFGREPLFRLKKT